MADLGQNRTHKASSPFLFRLGLLDLPSAKAPNAKIPCKVLAKITCSQNNSKRSKLLESRSTNPSSGWQLHHGNPDYFCTLCNNAVCGRCGLKYHSRRLLIILMDEAPCSAGYQENHIGSEIQRLRRFNSGRDYIYGPLLVCESESGCSRDYQGLSSLLLR